MSLHYDIEPPPTPRQIGSHCAMFFPAMRLLVLCAVIGITESCSTTSFNPIQDIYPECARSCLACPHSSQSSNFYHQCDYPGGDCCTSQNNETVFEVLPALKKTAFRTMRLQHTTPSHSSVRHTGQVVSRATYRHIQSFFTAIRAGSFLHYS